MTARLAPFLCLGLLACDGVPDDSGTTGDSAEPCVDREADGCPCGWFKPRSSGLFFQTLTVDGASQVFGFDHNKLYDGVPATCIQDDKRLGMWRFDVGSQAYGSLLLGATVDGEHLTGEPVATVTIDLFGHTTPAVFDGANFTNGQISYDAGPPEVEVVLQGTAFSTNNVGLQLNVSLEASP